MIMFLHDNGIILTGQDETADATNNYYAKVLGSALVQDYAIDLEALGLPVLDLVHLDVPFSADEVEKVIKLMPLDKVGPGWLHWPLLQNMLEHHKGGFHESHGVLPPEDMRGMPAINNAVIPLLPKKDWVMELYDFRPVSLVHGADLQRIFTTCGISLDRVRPWTFNTG